MDLFWMLLMALVDLALLGLAAAFLVHGYFMLRNRVPYVVLPDGAVAETAEALGVRAGDRVFDLGCGDGRVLLALQRIEPKAKYFGVENVFSVWMMAMWRAKGRVKIARGEISGAQLGKANKIFAYLGPKMLAELEPRFAAELPKGARVVSVQFPLPKRPADTVVELEHSRSHAARLYVYNY
jgi:hypothetical protein